MIGKIIKTLTSDNKSISEQLRIVTFQKLSGFRRDFIEHELAEMDDVMDKLCFEIENIGAKLNSIKERFERIRVKDLKIRNVQFAEILTTYLDTDQLITKSNILEELELAERALVITKYWKRTDLALSFLIAGTIADSWFLSYYAPNLIDQVRPLISVRDYRQAVLYLDKLEGMALTTCYPLICTLRSALEAEFRHSCRLAFLLQQAL